jgi:hypothetical protein
MDAVEAFLDVFNDRNVDRLRELCDPQVRWLNERTGEWETGVEPLIDYNRAAMEGASEMRAELLDPASFESADQAAVSGRLVFHAVWDGQAYVIPCPTTFVLRRDGDDWKVIYEHALEYRPRTEG